MSLFLRWIISSDNVFFKEDFFINKNKDMLIKIRNKEGTKIPLKIVESFKEEIKINIGSAVFVDDELIMTIKGRDFLTGLPRSAEIKTNEIVKAISKELKDIVKAIKDVLQETPPELSSDIIDNGITMTGGSSQLRNLTELVYRRTGVKAHLAEDALFCVARGTGIALNHLDTYKKSIISKR
jgi:rod shape-determining protein MreB